MLLFDTHSHVSFRAYKDDQDQVIKRSLNEGVYTVTVGTQSSTNQMAIDLASRFDGVWASVGLHPIHINAGMEVDTANFDDDELDFKARTEDIDKEQFLQWSQNEQVVAIGECGLDYYRLDKAYADKIKVAQKQVFLKQMDIASQTNLPLIIHCRDAYEDQYELIKRGMAEYGYDKPGVMHCFTGTYEEAKLFLDLGWYISMSGIATFAKPVEEVAMRLPLDQMVIETDAPYLTPPPHRGKRNEPAYVRLIAEHIAAKRGISLETLAQATFKNAIDLFQLKNTI